MKTISATDAKNKLASVMNAAIKAPVMIEKNGKPYVVVMSAEHYVPQKRKQEVDEFIEFCEKMAKEAKRNGMSEEVLQSILEEDET